MAAVFVLGASLLVVLGAVRFGATGALTAAEDRSEEERRILIQTIDETEIGTRLPGLIRATSRPGEGAPRTLEPRPGERGK
jgi:hypothetical protein